LNEFDFSKISLSLERDLAPLENPLDAFRNVDALLRRALSELQGAGTQRLVSRRETEPASSDTRRVTENTPPAASKPPSLTVETVRERLAKWLPDLEILDGFDGFSVKPKRYLGDTWSEVNEVIRSLSGKWQKGLKSTDGAWRIPK
jgi:exonuclease VII small subunit